jgi:hypothetical protein
VGESIGHWEGQKLVIDTETIDANAQLLIFNVMALQRNV